MMHILEIKQHWAHYRLAFSSVASVLALTHFHYVVWCSTVPYPLTTYAARVVESLMAAIITLTVLLNALTQLLSEGALTRPLFAHSALMPRSDEDFNVALFRLGTASMEATAVAGLGNEVGAVASVFPAPPSPPPRAPSVVHGELEIDRTGVSGLAPAYERRAGGAKVRRRGFANEIARVRVKAASTDFWMDTVLNVAWQRHLGTFLGSAWRAARRVWAACVAWAAGMVGRGAQEPSAERLDSPPESMRKVMRERTRVEGEEDPYARFLRGEPVSDDEDDFVPDDNGTPRPDTPSSGSEDDEYEDAEEDRNGADDDASEQARLYADLSGGDSASAPLLLAHMTDTSPSPLTRKAYRRLLAGPPRVDAADDWAGFVDERRREKRASAAAVAAAREAAENPRACVICTVEPRDIICWPCR